MNDLGLFRVARLLMLQLASAHALMTSWWAGLHQPPNAERANRQLQGSRAMQCSQRTLLEPAHSFWGPGNTRYCLYITAPSIPLSATLFTGSNAPFPPPSSRNHRSLVRARQEAVVAMASQQQQIIDTIFSMKRKLLRGNDCMYKPPAAIQHLRVLNNRQRT